MEGADCDWWFGLNGRFARPYRGGSRQNLLTAAQVVIGSNYYPCYKLGYANRDCSRLVSRSRLMHDNSLFAGGAATKIHSPRVPAQLWIRRKWQPCQMPAMRSSM